LGVYFYFSLQQIGFPDGHLTALDRVLKNIYPIYSVICILFASYFFYLNSIKVKALRVKKLKFSAIAFIIFIGLLLLLEYYLRLSIEHGTGA